MYAELVCGPPGSGKTTYCEGRRQFLTMQQRRVITLNLDPANDSVFPYPCSIDIGDLISHERVMEEENLGPNGAYLFCIDYISSRVDWVMDKIRAQLAAPSPAAEEAEAMGLGIGGGGFGDGGEQPVWLLVDCPGQVEYYLHSEAMQNLISRIQRELRFSVCVVHLCDAAIATRDVNSYVATCLLALSTMTDLELPHLNVLTKWDTVVAPSDSRKAMTAEEEHEAELLATAGEGGGRGGTRQRPNLFHGGGTKAHEEMEPYLDTPTFLDDHFKRLWKEQHGTSVGAKGDKKGLMAQTLLEVMEGYNLVSFLPLDVQDQDLMFSVGEQIDAAVGHLIQ